MSAVRNVFVAETDDVRPFARLLRGVGLKHNAVMTASEAGFEVTVEEIKTMCAIAWIPAKIFKNFEFHEPENDAPACFEISLDGLLQCLNIFGNATTGGGSVMPSKRRWAGEGDGFGDDEVAAPTRAGKTQMILRWGGPGARLEVDLQGDESGPRTTCELTCLDPEELMNQNFNQEDTVLNLIMKSEWFRDALADLPPTCDRVTLVATPPRSEVVAGGPQATASSNARRDQRAHVGSFSIKAAGDVGTTEFDYPADKQVMDRFDCEEPVSFSYLAAHFALLSRALHSSIKICLQIESTGFLCIQIMMPILETSNEVGDHSGILEFKMHALEEGDD